MVGEYWDLEIKFCPTLSKMNSRRIFLFQTRTANSRFGEQLRKQIYYSIQVKDTNYDSK